jgi:predicted CXXCH cytochrome family protein
VRVLAVVAALGALAAVAVTTTTVASADDHPPAVASPTPSPTSRPRTATPIPPPATATPIPPPATATTQVLATAAPAAPPTPIPPTPIPPTATPVPLAPVSTTGSATPTPVPLAPVSTTGSATPTVAPAGTGTPTPTGSATATPTVTATGTPTASVTPTFTPTVTVTPSITPTVTVTPSITPTVAIPFVRAASVGAPPTGPTPVPKPPAHNLHVAYGADTAACAACHRAHTARGDAGGRAEALRKAWPEEQVCYTCHDGTAAPNVKGEFARLGSSANGSAMPIAQTELVHHMDEARVAASFSGANRHVECEDCHNPHLAGKGNHQLGTAYAAAPQQGMWGVSATWSSSAWTPPTFGVVGQVTYQYELCFKCHSSWAFGGSPPRSPSGGFNETDQAVEFNPANPAYHPVAAVGKNPFQLSGGTSYAASLLNGLTPKSTLVCSDCHGSQNDADPAGPHGSNYPFILRGTWDRSTGVNSPNALCFKCHDPNVYANRSNDERPWDQRTGFSGDGKNLHAVMVGARNKANGDAPIVCMDCHVAVPHGANRDRLIAFTGDSAPYVNRPYRGGLTTIDTWQPSGQWTFDSCGTAMESCK